MSNKEQKAMKKSGKHQRVHKTLPSDDFKNSDEVNPADKPAVGTSGMGSHSSGSDMQEAREPVQKKMQDFKGDDGTGLLMEKRKQFEEDVNASFRSLNENLQSILKAQQNSRQELKSLYCERFGSVYHNWLVEMDRTRDQEEYFSFITQQQMKILQTAIEDHETKLKNAKDMCDTFLKKANDLSKRQKTFIGGQQTIVEKEISKVQNRVIMETQDQDIAMVETYLQSLIHESSEETI
ncbi:X-linked lymphocyte-regulated 5B isoform X1 [Mus musculus]|uniref:X-linked lymphocyte-regulated 5B n=2 Tax=Mus musculus TaxID=10090 RepID=A2BI50_MOUSE|nr:X-linked lymphocyte-regulated 5B [Mus musculus]XP_006528281.1 X-linked lymphocyte-regulated 5B isoform X1 [Mus musculus]XP_006528282.1 X-linked lymphocyte-regulated 5B isoform X1 [Mus musculus]XP_006528283.1 X-linked lymphocyte-regulated 5B isoform X1 [Mus musculus]XP_006528284.1 X-linked lymphocyte-regulated 5B isoform X1 [Mus musculus]XP_006528285.1 X-linked lymphocyte-regulated 5B isoform X1 [Mus musculus]XP_006528286.1 X-linked lymphocyte-regulated 5B isoform X1 [Mus musculus]XP_00652|eukprot:NP_001104763.1 X-linked lymphocyte-regulated 5B [Mus musculus]